ncbi:MAG: hypothetical protein US25_C0053G0010 [Candidatus Moranbacteria bacterium GW2011_GWE1_36_7]|nr:MAG: hypothetical protein UR99_C0016G0028 [Candidatus Moranbacteria bacterium GW2011_GWD2_36_12]KKQ06256.1 MAG: hypothetical protein US16_C0020G0002 [Candidatus Moranbacteria bacterium GW2011_GWE2_36_40]KKQ12326.1 MAG: hypothetical protein US25_C0053G0010 [Candidatus Moranbacteria bacterium GW2011_GWE1_36_7]
MMIKSIDSQDSANVSHYLGLDFGVAKIGLAIADEETQMAFAFDTLKNDSNFMRNLAEILERKNVKTIVMGLAWHEKDEESFDRKMAFGKKIEKELKIAVMFQDEMFTTKMAHQNIKLRGGKNIAEHDDSEAARIILQSWIDNRSKISSHES